MGPYIDVRISKRYSHSYGSFATKLFLNVRCDRPDKCLIPVFFFVVVVEKTLKFIVANGKLRHFFSSA